jgi:DNA-binding response OmpR family regulator
MTRALIVEDDPRIRDTVVDVVESLGHEHDTASCQEAARKLLNGHSYAYALFDLEIPVKDGRSFPRIENGINLLREAIGQFGKRTPVIVMTAHGNDGPHQGVDCIKMGAADYIPKPFPIRGRTLDKAILEALDRSGQSGSKATVSQKPSGPPRPFNGGRMVLYKRQVEICGVDIPISQLMYQILTLLSEKRPNGQYVAHAGSDLMERLGSDCGQNGIASQVLEFRNKVAQRLLEEANVTCERTSIIASGGPGYRLQEWITVESGENTVERQLISIEENLDHETPPSAHVLSDSSSPSDLNERQKWSIGEMKKGVLLQSRHLVERFGCSTATAKRDLASLKAIKLARFVGSARSGHYQLTSPQQSLRTVIEH